MVSGLRRVRPDEVLPCLDIDEVEVVFHKFSHRWIFKGLPQHSTIETPLRPEIEQHGLAVLSGSTEGFSNVLARVSGGPSLAGDGNG